MSKRKEAELQQLIDKIVADSAVARQLAVELYGEEANLFEESNLLFVMSGDCDGPPRERQKFIKLTASGYYWVGGGAW
ncbi:hypothetical protein KVG88_30160 [Pseudomonas sp. SWRI74]|uniref:Uncharacterized protein n=1 Tax=Pseudomonas azerbaijanoccidentalis TaxID=2842347 RepID=A0ABS6QZH9_9PSED|nr:hypothetical protein [Pseudomonas azerbaijanoccidentalis]MBV4524340.1 hypothetical protein [Pseudomonas azerbaijanoccidentalis]